MIINLPYGNRELTLELPEEQLLQIVQPPPPAPSQGSIKILEEAFKHPIASNTLKQIVEEKKARRVVIVVNDITRRTPYRLILPPLLKELEAAGIKHQDITLLVALGIHRPHTQEENISIFSEEICKRYRIENHDCDNNLVSLGYLSNGMELIINRTAAEADLLITTGLVNLHYFAGYSGGRKSILPGIAGRKLIQANHQMMSDERACLGNYRDNPVSDIMMEAARKAGVDYIINVVTAGRDEILYAATGDMYEAWLSCVKYCEEHNVVGIKQQADVVIASCGGFPKDINMYQAQKALDSASLAVKPGGTIILLAECREGMGEETFEEWIMQSSSPGDIINRFNNCFELGGHKAYAICRTLNQANIILISSLKPALVEKMYMHWAPSMEAALELAYQKQGDHPLIIVMPEASKNGIRLESE